MNIVLIGFKSSGKSTIGAILAQLAGMSFIDTDSLVESLFDEQASSYLSCRGIYQKFGAAFMRELEAEALKTLVDLDNFVIATGGGVVLQAENVSLLHNTGLTVFLDVPLAVLQSRLADSSSPLFKDKSIAQVYAERYPLYVGAAKIQYPADVEINPQEQAVSLYSSILGYISKT